MVKKIKDIYHIRDDYPVTSEKYEIWLMNLLNKTENEVDENDVYTMFSQHELGDLAIKKSIELILNDPLAGEMWNGQFLELLAKEPIEQLQKYKTELRELLLFVDQKVDDLSWDSDFEREEFLEKYEEFKKVIPKL